jgi:hypothetical protein
LIGFDPETWQGLDVLSRDSGKDLQALADEAFGDLLAKHPPATHVEGCTQAKHPAGARQREQTA